MVCVAPVSIKRGVNRGMQIRRSVSFFFAKPVDPPKLSSVAGTVLFDETVLLRIFTPRVFKIVCVFSFTSFLGSVRFSFKNNWF